MNQSPSPQPHTWAQEKRIRRAFDCRKGEPNPLPKTAAHNARILRRKAARTKAKADRLAHIEFLRKQNELLATQLKEAASNVNIQS